VHFFQIKLVLPDSPIFFLLLYNVVEEKGSISCIQWSEILANVSMSIMRSSTGGAAGLGGGVGFGPRGLVAGGARSDRFRSVDRSDRYFSSDRSDRYDRSFLEEDEGGDLERSRFLEDDGGDLERGRFFLGDDGDLERGRFREDDGDRERGRFRDGGDRERGRFRDGGDLERGGDRDRGRSSLFCTDDRSGDPIGTETTDLGRSGTGDPGGVNTSIRFWSTTSVPIDFGISVGSGLLLLARGGACS
jgi:hypothetical protein